MVAGFRIEEFIGAGAMAVVYKAVQMNLERSVALKILPRDFSRSRDYVDRFFNEARAAAAFSHPNIVRAYDAGIDDNNTCYFAMEFVEGETVLDRIMRDQVIPLLDGLQIALKIAGALEYGWREHRLTHGDIKPANLMINSRGETKLADFGLAKVAEIEDVSGSVMLTPLYACPEVIQGYRPEDDCRPDIYAFGATLYHMFSGAPPFPGEDSKEVMRMQVEAALTPLNHRNPQIPRHVSDFVASLLRKDPEKRVQSWKEVVAGLKEVIGDLTRKGVTAVATASDTTSKRILSTHAHGSSRTRRRSARIRGVRKRSGSGMLIAGSVVGAVLVGLLAAGLFVVASRTNQPSTDAPDNGSSETIEQGSPPSLPDPEEVAMRPWHQFRRRVQAETSTETRVAMLRDFARRSRGKGYQSRVIAMLERERRKLAAESKPPSPLPPKPPPDGNHQTLEPEPDPAVEARRARQRADEYTLVAAAAADYQLSFIDLPDEVDRMAVNWQDRFPEESEFSARVAFLHEQVVPAYARLKAVLIGNAPILEGLQLPGMEDCVRTLDTAGIATIVILDGGVGKVERKLGWADVSSTATVKAFARQLVKKHEPSDDELRSALSCMLFDGAENAVAAVSKSLPDDESRMWILLSKDVAAAPAERAALSHLAAAGKAIKKGAFLTANGLLDELTATPTTVRVRYREQIEGMLEKIRPFTPESQLEQLTEKAETLIVPNPQEALRIVVTANGRYGALGTSEATELKALRKRIVEQLAEEFGVASPSGEFFADYRPHLDLTFRRTGRSLGVLHYYDSNELLPREVNRYRDAFEGLCWIEVEDWQSATTLFANLAINRRADLPPNLSFLFAYGDALLNLRFSGHGGILDHRLAEMHGMSASEPPSYRHAALALQFAIVSERTATASALAWPDLNDVTEFAPGMREYMLSLLALKLTVGDVPGARELCRRSKRFLIPDLVASEQPMPAEIQGLAEVLWLDKRLSGGAEPGEDEQPGHLPDLASLRGDPGGRWVLHMLATGNRLRGSERKQISAMLGEASLVATPLDAKRVFESTILAAIAGLEDNDIGEAVDVVDQLLEPRAPALNGYYPRILGLKAGLLSLGGQPRAAQETLMLMEASTVAATGERKWVELASRPPSGRVTRIKSGDVNVLALQAYWEAWLNACYWKTKGNDKMAGREAKVMRGLSSSPVKILLAGAVARWQFQEEAP